MYFQLKSYRLLVPVAIVLVALIWGFSSKSSTVVAAPTATVKRETLVQSVQVRGRLALQHTQGVFTPWEGSIQHLHVAWGQYVKEGTILVSLSSASFRDHFYTIVSDYLTSHALLSYKQDKMKGDQLLWKEGVISKNDLQASQRDYQREYLSYFKKKLLLRAVLQLTGQKAPHISSLKKIEDMQAFLNSRHTIHLRASRAGIWLPPPWQAEKNKDILDGQRVQKNQLLGQIGDDHAWHIRCDVSEKQRMALHQGQAVSVSTLGHLKPVNAVISRLLPPRQKGGRIQFPIDVDFTLTPSLKKQGGWYIGGHGFVTMVLGKKEGLTVPVTAVLKKAGQYIVVVKTPYGSHDVQIMTGLTAHGRVIVMGDIQEGDQVVLH